MATLSESQAFLDQFDKCLPLCERGDAVTVVNALHSLNEITKAGLPQGLDKKEGKIFFVGNPFLRARKWTRT